MGKLINIDQLDNIDQWTKDLRSEKCIQEISDQVARSRKLNKKIASVRGN